MKHALVIEDNVIIAEMIRDYLGERGYETVDIATTQDEATRLAVLHCPQLITADAILSRGSGAEAIRSICRDIMISVIFIMGEAEDVSALPDARFLLKPFSENALSAAVQEAEGSPQTFA